MFLTLLITLVPLAITDAIYRSRAGSTSALSFLYGRNRHYEQITRGRVPHSFALLANEWRVADLCVLGKGGIPQPAQWGFSRPLQQSSVMRDPREGPWLRAGSHLSNTTKGGAPKMENL